MASELNLESARIARAAARRWSEQNPDKPRFVAGALGPTPKTLSIGPDVNDPAFRAICFDELRAPTRSRPAPSSKAAWTCCWSRPSSTP